jgi:hypothetical protein
MKHLKHVKHALATWGRPGRAIPAVGIGAGGARAPPPSLVAPGLARLGERRARRAGVSGSGWVSATVGKEWREMGARQQRGGVGTRRPDGKAAAGEGRFVGEDQRRAGGVVVCQRRSHTCGSEEKKFCCVFLLFWRSHVVLK